jgi:signal peptidase
MTRVGRRLVAGVVTAVLLAMVGFLGSAWLGHWTFHIVQSGSMAPAVPRDSLAAVAPAPEGGRAVGVGDVVAFSLADRPRLTIIHRVVERIEQGGAVFYRTKGDANAEPDVRLVPADAVRGTVAFDVPRAGVVVRHLQPPWTWLLFVGGPLGLLVSGEVRGRTRRRKETAAAARPAPLCGANIRSSTVGECGLGESSAAVGRARAAALGPAAHGRRG